MFVIISILFVNRNPQISPWFPVCVLSYPIFEVLFSMYRRIFSRGYSPLYADSFHLHSIIYKRVSKENHLTAPYLWILVLPFNFMALLFHKNTPFLIFLFLCFYTLYVFFYKSIVEFKIHRIPFLKTLKSLINGHKNQT